MNSNPPEPAFLKNVPEKAKQVMNEAGKHEEIERRKFMEDVELWAKEQKKNNQP